MKIYLSKIIRRTLTFQLLNSHLPYILSGDKNSDAGKVFGSVFGVGIIMIIVGAVVWAVKGYAMALKSLSFAFPTYVIIDI